MTTREFTGAAILPPPLRPVAVLMEHSEFDESIWIPSSAFTLSGFRNWSDSEEFPERGRISFLNGAIVVDMSHERISSHVSLKGELARALISLLNELGIGQFFTDGVRILNESAGLSHEPDGCLVTWAAFTDGRVRLQPSSDGKDMTEIVGAPDMVVEIVSPSSAKKDKSVLPSVYHKAGVGEYWLIDARKDEIFFEIQHRHADGFKPSTSNDGWPISSVLQRQFQVTRTRNPLGVWTYSLNARAIDVDE